MHDSNNTRGGEVGFEVELADGSRIHEDAATWDEVQGQVKSLALIHMPTGLQWMRLEHYERFFFPERFRSSPLGRKWRTRIARW